MRPGLALLSLPLLLACGGRSSTVTTPRPARSHADATEPAPGPAQQQTSAHPPARSPGLRDLLCEDHDNCEVKETLGSIPGQGGGTRALIRTSFPEPPALEGEADPRCTFEEFWLVAQSEDGQVRESKRLTGGCVRPAPLSSWCGVPPTAAARVQGNHVIIEWYEPEMRCTGARYNRGTQTYSLETFHSLHWRSTFAHQLMTETETASWDWSTLSGSSEWSAESYDCPLLERGPILMLPKLKLDSSFSSAGWQTTSIAGCSMKLDDRTGVSLGGAKAKVELLLVIGAGDTLFVELQRDPDAQPSTGAHLRICTANSVPAFGNYCKDKRKPDCNNVLLDGSTASGALKAERSPDGTRFKIPLPHEPGAVTVAYIDPKSKRSLATSTLSPFDSTMLNSVYEVLPNTATCQVIEHALTLIRNPKAL